MVNLWYVRQFCRVYYKYTNGCQGATTMATPTFEQMAEFYEQVKAKRITLENFQAFLRNPNQYLESKSVSDTTDLIPNGWTVVEDIAPSQFDVNKLKPRSFLKKSDKKGYINSEEMRKRVVEFKGNLGLSDAKRMLAEQDKIPTEFRDFYIPFPGTVLRDSDGDLIVPYLCWGGDRWYLGFRWLGNDWFDGDRFACRE